MHSDGGDKCFPRRERGWIGGWEWLRWDRRWSGWRGGDRRCDGFFFGEYEEVREGENPTRTGRGLWGRVVIIYGCARELREFCDEGGGVGEGR